MKMFKKTRANLAIGFIALLALVFGSYSVYQADISSWLPAGPLPPPSGPAWTVTGLECWQVVLWLNGVAVADPADGPAPEVLVEPGNILAMSPGGILWHDKMVPKAFAFIPPFGWAFELTNLTPYAPGAAPWNCGAPSVDCQVTVDAVPGGTAILTATLDSAEFCRVEIPIAGAPDLPASFSVSPFDIAITEGDDFIMNVEAADPEGNPVTLALSRTGIDPVPSWVEFTDNADGTGTIRFRPGFTVAPENITDFQVSAFEGVNTTFAGFAVIVQQGEGLSYIDYTQITGGDQGLGDPTHGAAGEDFPVSDMSVKGDEKEKKVDVCFKASHAGSKIVYVEGKINIKKEGGVDVSKMKLTAEKNITAIESYFKDGVNLFKAYLQRHVENIEEAFEACFSVWFSNTNTDNNERDSDVNKMLNPIDEAKAAEIAMNVNVSIDSVTFENGKTIPVNTYGEAEFRALEDGHGAAGPGTLGREWTLNVILFVTVIAAASYILKRNKKHL